MAKTPLFTDDDATDIGYVNVRAARNNYTKKAREDCERLWAIYKPHADREFRIEMRSNFDARYWEMYLTTSLIQQGFKVCCPKPGPDVGIEFARRRIWFEATSPARGADESPDQVPKRRMVAAHEEPVFQDVPNEKMVLRYLNSISEKYKNQYASWLKKKVVAPEDAFVIAINPRSLGSDHTDTDPPRILQAAFMVGNPYMEINPKSGKAVGSGYQLRTVIAKASGEKVDTGVFDQPEYSGLSGLLCSRVDAVNQPDEMGGDFQLVPNPRAKAPLPTEFRLKGMYFRIEPAENGYTAFRETNS